MFIGLVIVIAVSGSDGNHRGHRAASKVQWPSYHEGGSGEHDIGR
jgi:hypothetical protein